MEDTPTRPPTPTKRAELEAALKRIISEIDRTTERIKAIQEHTEKLGEETRAILAQLRTL